MRYLPHTDGDIVRMLTAIGISSIDELFTTIPEPLRMQGDLNLPEPMDEAYLRRHMSDLADQAPAGSCFAGGGAYRHYIPAAIDHIVRRNEFYTAYTPYQPEISQGTLQAIFEFQTMITRLLALDVANASMYDGASATAEAVLMAMRTTKLKRVLLSAALHPQYQETIATYAKWAGAEFVTVPVNAEGRTDFAALKKALNNQTAAVVVQSPNYLGVIEDTRVLGRFLARHKAKFVHVFTEPLAFGKLVPPGACGADIACGEGQSLGIPLSFGGPGLGILATRLVDVRQMPGRLVGETVDAEGKRAFCLTLSTREQHIRREKATSNICTNHGLMALSAAVYMALMGREGLFQLAKLNRAKTEYMKSKLAEVAELPLTGPTFNEFVWKPRQPAEEVLQALAKAKFIGGVALNGAAPGLENAILTCVTELCSRKEIDRYVEVVRAL
jgi:glycine dehydrogenase subunit 1